MEAAADRSCKGCRSDVRVTEEQIGRILAAPMFQPGSGHCVPDAVYEERLRLCGACPKLLDGHTCALCGCFVKIAAKLKDKSCPAPGGAGWQRYS
ncbi:DUF6171 family protein [Paenibacillus thermotolerans]|uniref:DUF6171 family protein n=1 Tax=Paenibacillus thermotolerans TaxID=3027807 RepID=UPI0023676145|nr:MULTISPECIES: DUF6171 family protein [unclassified Paenibacillus]